MTSKPLKGLPFFELGFLAEHTDEALLAELRRIAALIVPGTPLSKANYKAHNPRVSSNTIHRRFGGWTEALAQAGISDRRNYPLSDKIKLQRAKSMSKQDVLEELQRVHTLAGTSWLTTEAFNANSLIAEGAIRRHFGTFRKGLEAAGIPSHPRALRPLTNQECFENLANVWTHLGRVPQYKEMWQPPSEIQGKRYVTRWKSWRGALTAFVAWTNDEGKGGSPIISTTETKVLPLQQPQSFLSEQDAREVRLGLRFKVFRRDLFRCVACGRSPATHLGVELHADHILAVANGGKTTFENLQTLCSDCNLGKGKT